MGRATLPLVLAVGVVAPVGGCGTPERRFGAGGDASSSSAATGGASAGSGGMAASSAGSGASGGASGCAGSGAPCSGVPCCQGTCDAQTMTCPAPCKADGLGCDTAADCCGRSCLAGICQSCTPGGSPCNGESCCTGLACDDKGTCATCSTDGQLCGEGKPCCTGLPCVAAMCNSKCNPFASQCAIDSECCTQVCTGGKCACSGDFDPCSQDSDCCLGATCSAQGYCGL